MNRNKKILNVTMAAGMAAVLGTTPVIAAAQEADNGVSKEETVYVNATAEGEIKDITVSDWLKNSGSAEGDISDVSDLEGIKNVKGDETFSENNGKLVWQGDKKDICYQGTTTKKIPVGMKVTYELDGKKVSADDLEGKSGHLKIHYEYQNTSADSGKYTPFLMATGLLMDGEKFSNVTVDNGKVISDGDRDIVI